MLTPPLHSFKCITLTYEEISSFNGLLLFFLIEFLIFFQYLFLDKYLSFKDSVIRILD